ncbi:MAG: hypothetical protein H7A54_00405 [Akkermansiaceae bacterium]|nr:hypothetical protein [Akkermansiaceae bacterium]
MFSRQARVARQALGLVNGFRGQVNALRLKIVILNSLGLRGRQIQIASAVRPLAIRSEHFGDSSSPAGPAGMMVAPVISDNCAS